MAPARALHQVAICHRLRCDREAFVAREPDHRSLTGSKRLVNLFGVAGVEWAAERDKPRGVAVMVDDREMRLRQEQARVLKAGRCQSSKGQSRTFVSCSGACSPSGVTPWK